MSWTVSVKGVVLVEGRVLLAFNDRQEWELPGGQLEVGETPEECVAREILEETSLVVSVGGIIDAWVFDVMPGKQVLIVAYECTLTSSTDTLRVSSEHTDVRFIPLRSLSEISLPDGYRNAISLASQPS